MTEREICDWMYARFKEGQKRYDTGSPNPYPANTVASFLETLGWCSQDHRRALMKADPVYGADQRRFEANGVFK